MRGALHIVHGVFQKLSGKAPKMFTIQLQIKHALNMTIKFKYNLGFLPSHFLEPVAKAMQGSSLEGIFV